MAASAGITGKGTTIGYSTSIGGTYTTLAEILDSNTPEVTSAKVEATHYLSDDGTAEFKPSGWKMIGDINVVANFLKAQYATLLTLVGNEKFYKVTVSDGSSWVVRSQIGKLGGDPIPNKDMLKAKFTIEALGAMVYTAGA